MIIQVLAAFVVTIAFSIMFSNGKHQLIYCGIVGAAGWFAYLLTIEKGGTVVLASFFGALLVSILSTLLSNIRKAPITVYQITGIIPLVPGMGMYQTLDAVIRNDTYQVVYHFLQTIQIAGALAIAMMLIYTLRTLTKTNNPKDLTDA